MQGIKQFSVCSATIHGAEAIPVQVEVIVSSGMPGISIVGMPDTVVHEARERVRGALRSCNLNLPGEKIVINLAPSYVKKSGSGFDLPIAVALLAATGQIPTDNLYDKMIVGELSLDGEVRPVQGLVAYQMCAYEQGLNLLCAPTEDALMHTDTQQHIYCVNSLRAFLERDFTSVLPTNNKHKQIGLDYVDIGGQHVAKRALQIAAAGNHALLMIGPPGSGKSMLAKCLPSILPRLSPKEIAESARIASIVGEPIDSIMQGIRPFRSPHHSATLAGLIGGGNPVHPGEVSLAHNGVLMLDELNEFSHAVLQGLRQPIEDGQVSITRADGNVVMPSRFMLIASSNPCPCGYFGDSKISCNCPLSKVVAYQNRIGGPLIDRFDMSIDVLRGNFDQVVTTDSAYNSETLKEGVEAARAFAFERYRRGDSETSNVSAIHNLLKDCRMQETTQKYFKEMSDAYVLSGRGIMRILRVARTIADLSQSIRVDEEHLAEAFTLRMRTTNSYTHMKVS